jgi:hypothetical protein
MERAKKKKKLIWPDLVFKEFLAVVAVSIILVVWSLLMNAPLMEIASPGRSENPSKAPWYFVGLQELLVYFDPWIAGVMIPSIIITGLILIPYIDRSHQWSLDPIIGLISLGAYFGLGMVTPRLISEEFYRRCGFIRYILLVISMLLMYFIPIKIFLRLAFNIKYILVTPWFNV